MRDVIPLIGSLAALVLGVYFDGFIFGADYLDFPMSLRGMRRRSATSAAPTAGKPWASGPASSCSAWSR